jgi:5-methylcytosine-specific restriction endonuclease McrA
MSNLFDERYAIYLESPVWREKRVQVLKRDIGQCQAQLHGCLTLAQEVHHLRYRNVGCEPLYELVALCWVCHQKLTKMERQGRKPDEVWPYVGP